LQRERRGIVHGGWKTGTPSNSRVSEKKGKHLRKKKWGLYSPLGEKRKGQPRSPGKRGKANMAQLSKLRGKGEAQIYHPKKNEPHKGGKEGMTAH